MLPFLKIYRSLKVFRDDPVYHEGVQTIVRFHHVETGES